MFTVCCIFCVLVSCRIIFCYKRNSRLIFLFYVVSSRFIYFLFPFLRQRMGTIGGKWAQFFRIFYYYGTFCYFLQVSFNFLCHFNPNVYAHFPQKQLYTTKNNTKGWIQKEIFWMLMYVSWPTVKKSFTNGSFFVQRVCSLLYYSQFLYKIQNSLNCKIFVDSRNDAIRIPETKKLTFKRRIKKNLNLFFNYLNVESCIFFFWQKFNVKP